jgi:hypothetical protein
MSYRWQIGTTSSRFKIPSDRRLLDKRQSRFEVFDPRLGMGLCKQMNRHPF